MSGVTSTREAARRLGLSDTALRKAERAGRIAREPDGSWDVECVRRALAKRQKFVASGPAPWSRFAQRLPTPGPDIAGAARSLYEELEKARQALDRAARQIAALYPEILRLERACDAAIAAQEREEA
jgi:hypothetical protein